MTTGELAALLQAQMKRRQWTVSELAKNAGMPYETVRRAVRGIGTISLANTNKLLTALDVELVAEASPDESEVSA